MIFNKLKTQLLFAFFIVITLLVLTFFGSGYLYLQKNKVTDNIRELDEVRVLALKNFKLIDDYISYETSNEKYFVGGKSSIKAEFETNHFGILYRLKEVNDELSIDYPGLSFIIDSLIVQQKLYNANFAGLEQLVLLKGFKDSGTEGRMRDYAHQLMSIDNKEINHLVLGLRRHEKDYIIRKDIQYFNKFNETYDELIREISSSVKIEKQKKNYAEIAGNYKKHFSDYCNLQSKIGVNEREGVLMKLNNNYKNINSLFDKEKILSEELEFSFDKTLKAYNITLLLISIVIAIVLGYWYAARVAKRVRNLNRVMDQYIESGFVFIPEDKEEVRIDEFNMIHQNFLRLAKEINTYVNHFKIKVEERTAEIRWQKEEIEQQNKKISSQHNLLQTQQNELIIQQKQLAEKNRNFLESVRHAEKIQQALLPSHHLFKKYFTDAFVFFQPRDIVSGDFYWLEEFEYPVIMSPEVEVETTSGGSEYLYKNESNIQEVINYEKRILFALADCTGHGVPGAFMSIVGVNHINKIVKEARINEPDKILLKLNEEVKRSFSNQENGEEHIKDGMEVAFCAYIPDKQILQFCGANKNLLLIRENHIYEFKGNKKPVGISFSVSEGFERTDIKMQRGDVIYLFTDGYQDQFGGERNKKFKISNLKQLLLKVNQFPMKDQYAIIKSNFNSWKGEGFQVDDVLLIGIKF